MTHWLLVSPGPVEEDKHLCIQCRARVDKVLCCGRCKAARYCGKECQVAAWPVHKLGCAEIVAHQARVAALLSGDPLAASAAAATGTEKIRNWVCGALGASGVAPESRPFALLVVHSASEIARSIDESPMRNEIRGLTPFCDGADRVYLVSIQSARALLFNYPAGDELDAMHAKQPRDMIVTRIFADNVRLQFAMQTQRR
jgi:MYND finger